MSEDPVGEKKKKKKKKNVSQYEKVNRSVGEEVS